MSPFLVKIKEKFLFKKLRLEYCISLRLMIQIHFIIQVTEYNSVRYLLVVWNDLFWSLNAQMM